MVDQSTTTNQTVNERAILIISIFIAGLCSIVYELLISTTSSYFLGNSIKQFSLTIGIYMAAMGLGSFLSRLIQKDLLLRFIGAEILLGFIGGSCVPLLYLFFASTDAFGFMVLDILLILVIGILTGLEIPLLTRIMKYYYPLKINLSNVLSLDYLGALLATLLFPFILLPWLGTFKSSLIFGIINLSVGFLNLWYFAPVLEIKRRTAFWIACISVTLYFVVMLFCANGLLAKWNDSLFRDTIILREQTPYQELVMTKGGEDIRLYIDRVIQWSSIDEYRYHESLTHIPMAMAPYRKKALILGGGEGLAARELLKDAEFEEIVIVDLDQRVFDLASQNAYMQEVNQGSLQDPRVKMVAEDAFTYLENHQDYYDLIIADLPDPTNESLTRLYSKEFFGLVRRNLSAYGVFATQATSPFHSNRAFWTIHSTLEAAGFQDVKPYHAYVPSFGDWGFIVATPFPNTLEDVHLDYEARFLEDSMLKQLFYFEPDLRLEETVPVNTLDHPVLLEIYLADWRRWSRESSY